MIAKFFAVASLALAATISTSAFANDAVKLPRPAADPLFIVGVYDISTMPATVLQNATASKHNANHQMCWRVENLTPQNSYSITENFTTPVGGKFVDADARNGRSPSGRNHLVTRTMTADIDGAVQKCWVFGNDDPNGEYQIQLNVENLKFPMRIFYVGE